MPVEAIVIAGLFIFGFIVLLGVVFWGFRSLLVYALGFARPENAWLRKEKAPHLLRASKLAMLEKDIECQSPIALHGRPDMVFLASRGRHIVVDTKSGFGSGADVFQLSCYGYILRRNGKKVHRYGYIRRVSGEINPSISYERVHLLSDSVVEGLRQDYCDVAMGRYRAKCTCGKCRIGRNGRRKRKKKASFALA